MKLKFALLVFLLSSFLFSCKSTYKNAQTPDDLYFSPIEKVEKKIKISSDIANKDDDYLRMRINNRNLWRSIDDFNYWHDSRFLSCSNLYFPNSLNNWNNWGLFNGCNSCCQIFNSHNSFLGQNLFYNNFYSPFYNMGYYSWNNPVNCFVSYFNPKSVKAFSKNNTIAYSNPKYNNVNYNRINSSSYPKGSVINSDNRVRTIRSSDDDARTFSNPSRTFESGSTPSSSAGGNSGGFNSKGSNTSKPRG